MLDQDYGSWVTTVVGSAAREATKLGSFYSIEKKRGDRDGCFG